MKTIGAFPTWAIVCVLLPFVPKTHPWHGRSFSLSDWHAHQTSLCRMFDAIFYVSVAGFAIGVALLIGNR